MIILGLTLWGQETEVHQYGHHHGPYWSRRPVFLAVSLASYPNPNFNEGYFWYSTYPKNIIISLLLPFLVKFTYFNHLNPITLIIPQIKFQNPKGVLSSFLCKKSRNPLKLPLEFKLNSRFYQGMVRVHLWSSFLHEAPNNSLKHLSILLIIVLFHQGGKLVTYPSQRRACLHDSSPDFTKVWWGFIHGVVSSMKPPIILSKPINFIG